MSHPTVETATEFANLDPRALAIETNVRSDAGLTPEFIDSVREHGVLVPILVQRTTDGQLLVRAGQRRTLAAIEAGLETIPARIVDADGDQARRIIEQVVENDARAALRDADRVAGFQQLSLLGVPAAQIAKKTGHAKETVTTALGVAASKVATAVQTKYDLTLDQAAVIATFEGDDEAIKSLTATAVKDPGQFGHLAQRLRDQRDREAKLAAAQQGLKDAGVRQVSVPAQGDKTVKPLESLTDADGNALTPKSHQACPGHAAFLRQAWDGQVATVFVCDAWKANKHKTPGTTPGTPVDVEAAAKAKAERAEVVENNAAWRSAETVRREWLAGFAKRKTTPKDAATFIATALVTDTHSLESASTEGHPLAAGWLGIPGTLGGRDRIRDLIAKAGPARAQHITLVLVLAAIEARTGVQTWRRTGAERRYLTALESWGYTLSPVEQIARGEQPQPEPGPTANRPAPRTNATRAKATAPKNAPVKQADTPVTAATSA
ncbi:ParB N-terminal domain-containing protein [Antribacter sp. KLBMP9083]|uniref:ParB N-terminal domain-containing protein n=1 Tax=Antribacter soli TaxID=2910976 RepID=A0AA41UDE8_9MICO|nr:ParB N-terminal domain-containing protein [Antribacter soli]MCF4123014.1 ParB N-terminal domain-containing protein [Antribacter soli]